MDSDDLLADLQAPEFDLANDSADLSHRGGRAGRRRIPEPRGNRIEAQFAEGWEDSGLKEPLVDFAEARARERGMDYVDSLSRPTTGRARPGSSGRGYMRHHTAWILGLGPETPIAGRTLPDGYAMRTFTMDDAEALHRVIVAAFGEWDDARPSRTRSGAPRLSTDATVDPSAFRVATFADEVIGGGIVFDSADEAWVSHLAVDHAHRHRGVAQQLLADTYAAARERGLPHAGLSTDTRTGALDLYLRLGMRVKFTLDNWRSAREIAIRQTRSGRVTYSVGARPRLLAQPAKHSPSCYGDVP